MSANSRKGGAGYNSNSLKIRPDMQRNTLGLFNKSTIDGQERKVKRLKQPKNVLLLQ